jgi:hypothetical protein
MMSFQTMPDLMLATVLRGIDAGHLPSASTQEAMAATTLLTWCAGPTYIATTDGDALPCSPLTSVFSSFSGRAPPDRATYGRSGDSGSPHVRFGP